MSTVCSRYHSCLRCDKEFFTSTNCHSKYCDTCKPIIRLKKANERYHKKYPYKKVKCLECNKEFTVSYKRKFCSNMCYINNKRNRDIQKTLNDHYVNIKDSLYKFRFEILKRDNFRCQYCGRNPKDNNCRLHIDHIHPRSLGGDDSPENLITSCEECNLGKMDILLEKHTLKKLEVNSDL